MQLPTSITASPYTPANNVKSSQSPANRTSKNIETSRTEPSRAEKPAQPAVTPQTEDSGQAPFSAVVEANKVETSRLEAAVKRTDSNKSDNPAINKYLNMANEGAANAEVQDTSLFRVDVYV